MQEKYVIIVPTHSSYIDVCENFIEVLHRNWNPEKYICILSICGPQYKGKISEGWNVVYNGENTPLPTCVYNAASLYPSDYYFVFLGDAFIDGKVSDSYISELLNELRNEKIGYCKLEPQCHWAKTKCAGKLIRYIQKSERYAHSFVAYVASGKFIREEFCENITDREFELKYLEIANDPKSKNSFFDDRVIVLRNEFSITAGIEKGMWDRGVLNRLKKRYPDVTFAERDKVGIAQQLYMKARLRLLPFVPNGLRRVIKSKMMRCFGKWMDTKI